MTDGIALKLPPEEQQYLLHYMVKLGDGRPGGQGPLRIQAPQGHDGKSLNDQLGHTSIFGFRLLAGKPFYFFKEQGKVRISYGGQLLPQQYDEVPHYGCCDSTGFNPHGSERMVSFFGQRDGQWYYVDMGSYE